MTFGPINCIWNTIKLWLHVFNLTISNIVLPSGVCIPDELLLVRMLVKVISLQDNQRSHRKCMRLYILLVDQATFSSAFPISHFFFFKWREADFLCFHDEPVSFLCHQRLNQENGQVFIQFPGQGT